LLGARKTKTKACPESPVRFHTFKPSNPQDPAMAGAPNWLHVDTEDESPSPHLTTLSSCLALSDVQCDGYVRLLAADISLDDDAEEPSATLKVFRGLKLKQEQPLPGIPTAIESLYIDETEPKTPGMSKYCYIEK